ncbi:MAG: hypothetical protein D3923_12965, partial [Candidatus Electrothrix sp. AR3]|nr:hypothetical protein [Candidatus Electrothrix sp. AR3]
HQGSEDKARAELKQFKQLAENLEEAELRIAKLYIRWEKYDKAISLLEKMLQTTDLSEVRYLLAALRFQNKQYKKALDDLAKIRFDAKEYEDGLILQVRVLKQLDAPQEAITLLEAALAQEEKLHSDIYILLAGIYQLTEEEQLSLEVFQRALKLYPSDERLLYEYGLFLDSIGKQQQAMKNMQQLIKMTPEHAGALNYIGYTWADNNIHLNKAFLYISRAFSQTPDNPYIRDSLGWVHYRRGNLKKAVQTLEETVQLAPDDPAILDHLAEVYLAAGRSDDALKTWRRALVLYNEQASSPKKETEANKRIEKQIQQLEREKENK